MQDGGSHAMSHQDQLTERDDEELPVPFDSLRAADRELRCPA
jgi:hypothetical protein